jgi:hypothetical protein
MRYTFLPLAEQQHIKKEYRQRVAIVLLFFISISLIIGVGSLFPAYIYATLEERLDLNQVAAFKKSVDAASIASNQKELTAAGALLSSLDPYAQKGVFYSTATAVIAVRGKIKITSLALERPSGSGMTVTVAGVAPTRTDLLAFKDQLALIGSKTSVSLPISTLAKGTDVPFTIQITTTLP